MPRRLVVPVLAGVPTVATRTELVVAGVSNGRIRRLVEAGEWRAASDSIVIRSSVVGDRSLQRAAALQLGPKHAVTGAAGLRELGMRGAPAGPDVHVLMQHTRQLVAVPPLHLVRTTRWPETWPAGDDINVASGERCAIDAARFAPDLRSARAVLCAAACWGIDVESLVAELAHIPQQGSAVTRRAVGDVVAGARSAPEAELGDTLCAAVTSGALPPFLLNPDVHVDGDFVGTPDAWIVGTGVGVQVDSREFHGEEDDFDRTLARHDTYAAAGLSLLHVTPKRLRRLGASYIDVVVDAVEARRRSGGTEPSGLAITAHGPLLPIRP